MPRHYWKRTDPPENCAADLARRDALLSRIKALRISQTTLIREMEKPGMRTTRTELSGALHGGRRGPKISAILDMITDILERQEHESS